MTDNPISDDLHRFIRDRIRSLWALELLLLMQREPSRSWTAVDLDRALRANLSLVRKLLTELEHIGLVQPESDGTFRYMPKSDELRILVGDLEVAYSTKPFAVIRVVATRQSEQLQALADAFKLRKD